MFKAKPSDKECFVCGSKDCLDVTFDDKTFKGVVCWSDLKKLIGRKNGSVNRERSEQAAQAK